MIAEINLQGMYFPTLLLLAILAFFMSKLLIYLLAKLGVYRWVWHPALFDFSLFIVLLMMCTMGLMQFDFLRI